MTRGVEGFINIGNSDGNNSDGNNSDGNNSDGNNSDGNNSDDSDNDDIYIDCQPTGSDGKALYEENLSAFKPSISIGEIKEFSTVRDVIDDILNSPYFWIFVGLLISYIIIKYGKLVVAKVRGAIQHRGARKLAE